MSVPKCKIEPFNNWVVVEIPEQKEYKIGSLYVPGTAADNKPIQGTIAAVGPGKKEDVDMAAFALGDRVLFRQYAGTEFDHDGKKYYVLRADDVMCKVLD